MRLFDVVMYHVDISSIIITETQRKYEVLKGKSTCELTRRVGNTSQR